MNWYQLALFVHIVGVLGIFMAIAIELVSMIGARRAHTVEVVRLWSGVGKPLAVIFPVTSLLILGAGLTMTIGVWGWGQTWIDLSLALLILVSILGATVTGAHAKRIALQAAAPGYGPVPADLAREINHPVYWTSVMTKATIALGIVFLMTNKPGLFGSMITLTVALLSGIILALSLTRSSQAKERQIPEEQKSEASAQV